MKKSQAEVIQAVLDAGFEPAGTTSTEVVRIGTTKSPIFGGTGGELRVFGGRERFSHPNSTIRVTVGPKTTNVYTSQSGKISFLRNLSTKDIDPSEFKLDLLQLITKD